MYAPNPRVPPDVHVSVQKGYMASTSRGTRGVLAVYISMYTLMYLLMYLPYKRGTTKKIDVKEPIGTYNRF